MRPCRAGRALRWSGLLRRKRSDTLGRKISVVGGDWTINQADHNSGLPDVRSIRRGRLTISSGEDRTGACLGSVASPGISANLILNSSGVRKGKFCPSGHASGSGFSCWRSSGVHSGCSSRTTAAVMRICSQPLCERRRLDQILMPPAEVGARPSRATSNIGNPCRLALLRIVSLDRRTRPRLRVIDGDSRFSPHSPDETAI